MGGRQEAVGQGPSSSEVAHALTKASHGFRLAISDLLLAHIDDVVRLENEITVLREHISKPNRELLQRGEMLSSHSSDTLGRSTGHPTVVMDEFKRVKTDHLTWEETVTQKRQDALQASRAMTLNSANIPKDDSGKPRLTDISVSISAIPCFTKVMNHPSFELFFGVLILSNSLFMGVHTEIEASSDELYVPWYLYAIRYFYTILFTIELIIRALGKGFSKFVGGGSRWWNCMDVLVVLASWVEVITDIISFANPGSASSGGVNISNTRAMRILRVARLVRVLRIGRLLSFLRPLRVLVFSTINTLKTVFWALLLLLIIIYVFGMVFSQAVADHRKENKGHLPSADLDLYWGSLPKCMFTLFKAVTGGLSWHECVHPLGSLPWMWVLLFIVYISLTALAVMNVITGVFCQSAIDGTQTDRDIVTQKHLAMKQVYKETIKEVFKDIDTDNSDQITLEEFEAHFESEEARAFFASLEIEAVHAFEVFHLIDEDRGALDFEEFVNGCLRLRGLARSLEIAKLEAMAKRLDKKVVQILKLMQDQNKVGCLASFVAFPVADSNESTPANEPDRLQLTQVQSCAALADRQFDVCNI